MSPDDVCSAHGSVATNQTVLTTGLKRIEDKLDGIIERMGTGDTKFALLELRLAAAEERIKWLLGIVVGICGVMGLAIIGALFKLILKV